jgi:hypothetical protein
MLFFSPIDELNRTPATVNTSEIGFVFSDTSASLLHPGTEAALVEGVGGFYLDDSAVIASLQEDHDCDWVLDRSHEAKEVT